MQIAAWERRCRRSVPPKHAHHGLRPTSHGFHGFHGFHSLSKQANKQAEASRSSACTLCCYTATLLHCRTHRGACLPDRPGPLLKQALSTGKDRRDRQDRQYRQHTTSPGSLGSSGSSGRQAGQDSDGAALGRVAVRCGQRAWGAHCTLCTRTVLFYAD